MTAARGSSAVAASFAAATAARKSAAASLVTAGVVSGFDIRWANGILQTQNDWGLISI